MIILSKIFISAIIIVMCAIFALVVINITINFKNKNINKIVSIIITYLTNTFTVFGTGNLVIADNFINGILWLNDCIERTPTIIEAEGNINE